MNEFLNELIDSGNMSTTENGAFGYKTTGNVLVDMNFKLPSYRNDPELLKKDINNALRSGVPIRMLLLWLFYVRDARGGVGERKAFQEGLAYLPYSDTHAKIIRKLIPLIPEYGYYKDLFELLDTPVGNDVLDFIEEQIKKDYRTVLYNENPNNKKLPVSLLAKWMPSENASSKKSTETARRLAYLMGYKPKDYRKTLSKIRNYLDVVECDMSANRWGEIDYGRVPSKANVRYAEAFEKHDPERRAKYLEDVKNGANKINSSVNFPHEIYAKYADEIRKEWKNYEFTSTVYEELWKALPSIELGDTLVVCDGSGSMDLVHVPGSKTIKPIHVSRALAIYCARHMTGPFKDYFITFSAYPELIHLNGFSLADDIRQISEYDDCSNTNVESVFDLILNTAVRTAEKHPDMDRNKILPKNVLVISDMEFDNITYFEGDHLGRLFMEIQKRYRDAGFKMPRLIFWNVASRTNTIPIVENENGVMLVSGFSVNLLKTVMSGKTDMWDALFEAMTAKRYEPVMKVLFEEPKK